MGGWGVVVGGWVQDTLDIVDGASVARDEEESKGWARCISLVSSYPNHVLVEEKIDFGRRGSCHVQVRRGGQTTCGAVVHLLRSLSLCASTLTRPPACAALCALVLLTVFARG